MFFATIFLAASLSQPHAIRIPVTHVALVLSAYRENKQVEGTLTGITLSRDPKQSPELPADGKPLTINFTKAVVYFGKKGYELNSDVEIIVKGKRVSIFGLDSGDKLRLTLADDGKVAKIELLDRPPKHPKDEGQ